MLQDRRTSEEDAGRRRLVVVHNGRRDDYQVALALQEGGRLEALVTDFYSKSRMVPRRSNRELHSNAVRNTWQCVAEQGLWRVKSLVGTSRSRVDWSGVEHKLGARANALAMRSGAGVVAYAGLGRDGFPNVTGPRVLFVFHPMPGLIREVLAQDARQWGLSEQTLVREREFSERDAEEVALSEARMATQILVASSFSQRSVQEAVKPTRADVTVVPYGCPPVAPRARRSGPTKFLFVGQGVQRKGLHHLAAVWPQVADRHPQAQLTLVMGTVDPSLNLTALKGRASIKARVPQAALDALMDSHDVLVLPSLVEGFGLVITEALACGMHVLATDHTGLVDLPLYEGAGTLISAGEREQLRDALCALIEKDGLDHEASYATAADYQWRDYRAAVCSAL